MVWYEIIIDGVEYDVCEDLETAIKTFRKAVKEIIEEEFDGDKTAFKRETYDYDYLIVKREVLLDYHHNLILN